ncbi:PadR family transcriptional regulator [Acrocarpospora pleiomorpha]|nr:PadR family transcriptional regulator [Acrocarpospora pleiomorpha]
MTHLMRGLPRNGYELVQYFAMDYERLWKASATQVYAELSRMAESGLLELVENRASSRSHGDYILTDAGRQELERWLLHTEADHGVRDDSLLKLIAIGALDDEQAQILIGNEQAYYRRRALALEKRLAEWPEEHEGRIWRGRRAIFHLWLVQARQTLEWLEKLETCLKNPDMPMDEIF